MTAALSHQGFSADRVIFSIAIVYSESLFKKVKENNQHIILSLISILFAITVNRFLCTWKQQAEKSPDSDVVWRRIVSQWLSVAELTLTFIAIHLLVDVLNTMIANTERYYYETALFPVITLIFATSLVTVLENQCQA